MLTCLPDSVALVRKVRLCLRVAVICVTLLWTVRKMARVGLSPGDPNSYARPGMLGLGRCFQRFIKVGTMAVEDSRLMGCYALSTGRHLPVDKRPNTPANCSLNSLLLAILTRISVFQCVTVLRLVSSTVFYRGHEPQTLKKALHSPGDAASHPKTSELSFTPLGNPKHTMLTTLWVGNSLPSYVSIGDVIEREDSGLLVR